MQVIAVNATSVTAHRCLQSRQWQDSMAPTQYFIINPALLPGLSHSIAPFCAVIHKFLVSFYNCILKSSDCIFNDLNTSKLLRKWRDL